MSTKNSKRRGDSALVPKSPSEWQRTEKNTFRCKVILVPECETGFSVYAADLPGATSQGDTVEEALVNIAEALKALIAAYGEEGQDIPWTENHRSLARGAQVRWVVVHG